MTLDPQHSSPSRPRRRLDLIEDQDDVQAIPGYPDVPPALQMGKGLAFDDVFFFFFSLLRLEELRLFRSLFRSLFLRKEVLRFAELILPFRDSNSQQERTYDICIRQSSHTCRAATDTGYSLMHPRVTSKNCQLGRERKPFPFWVPD